MITNLHDLGTQYTDRELSVFWYVLNRPWRKATTVKFTRHPLGVAGQFWTETDYGIVFRQWQMVGCPMPDFSRVIIV